MYINYVANEDPAPKYVYIYLEKHYRVLKGRQVGAVLHVYI